MLTEQLAALKESNSPQDNKSTLRESLKEKEGTYYISTCTVKRVTFVAIYMYSRGQKISHFSTVECTENVTHTIPFL